MYENDFQYFQHIRCLHLEHRCPNAADANPMQANICCESKQTPDMLKILEVVFIHALRYWLCEDLGCKCAVLFAQYVNNIQ